MTHPRYQINQSNGNLFDMKPRTCKTKLVTTFSLIKCFFSLLP